MRRGERQGGRSIAVFQAKVQHGRGPGALETLVRQTGRRGVGIAAATMVKLQLRPGSGAVGLRWGLGGLGMGLESLGGGV